jgi:inorganic pyrophosphatase
MMREAIARTGARSPGSKTVNVVVETPAGSRSKFRLHKHLPLGSSFPFDFGFVPGTLAEDGDALDAVIVESEPSFTGCLVTVRLLGVIEAQQTEKGKTIRNDRLIVTPETEKIHPTARSLGDLPEKMLDQIEKFFAFYNEAEGRSFVAIGRRGPRRAARLIELALVSRAASEA